MSRGNPKTVKYISYLLIPLVMGNAAGVATSRSSSNSPTYSVAYARREDDDDGVPGTGSVPIQNATTEINVVTAAVTTTSTTTTLPPDSSY